MSWYEWMIGALGLLAYSWAMFILGMRAGEKTERIATAIDGRQRSQFTGHPDRCGFCGEAKHYSPRKGWYCLVCGFDEPKEK